MIFILVHVALTSLVACGLGLVFGQVTPAVSWTALIVGTAVASILAREKWTKNDFAPRNGWEWLAGIAGALMVAKHFIFIFFKKGESLWTLNPLNLGDLPLHIAYIRHISTGHEFWPTNPIFSGQRLHYPLGMDLYNAVWDSIGVDLIQHLSLTGLVLGLVGVWALLQAWGWVGVFVLFFAFSAETHWKNFFLSMHITQRGFLFALPAGALLMKLAWEHFVEGKRFPRKHYVVHGFLWGVMPLFHVHTFLAVSLTFLISMVSAQDKKFFDGVHRILPWGLLAVPLGLLVAGSGGGRLIHFSPGWMLEGRSLPVAWMNHLHIWWLVFYLGIWWLKRNKLTGQLTFLVLHLGWWVVFNFLILAPWDWDNLKVMYWMILGALLPVGDHLRQSSNRVQVIFLASVVVTTLLPSAFQKHPNGILDSLRSVAHTNSAVELYRLDEIYRAQEALKEIRGGGPFLVHPTYNHPIGFWGRSLVMGYPGHIWSHGISDMGREAQVRQIYKGEEGWKEALSKLAPRYIVWSDLEKKAYGSLNPDLSAKMRLVSSVQGFEIYEVTDP